MQASARGFAWLFLGRMVGGWGVGMLSCLAPLYLCEIAPREIRGSLLALEQFSIVTGVVIGFWYVLFRCLWILELLRSLLLPPTTTTGVCVFLYCYIAYYAFLLMPVIDLQDRLRHPPHRLRPLLPPPPLPPTPPRHTPRPRHNPAPLLPALAGRPIPRPRDPARSLAAALPACLTPRHPARVARDQRRGGAAEGDADAVEGDVQRED